jgi:hypothetical protein
MEWKFSTEWQITSTPAIGEDGTIYAASLDGHLYAITKKGRLKWKFQTKDMIESSPVIAEDGTILVGSIDGRLYAINQVGAKEWEFKTGEAIRSSPAIGDDGTIYVGSGDNKLYALSPDGTLKWDLSTGSWLVGSPTLMCPPCLAAQMQMQKDKALSVKIYKIHVEFDLYDDDELLLSDVKEIDPKRLSKTFRKSVIRRMELLLQEMIDGDAQMSNAELTLPTIKKLESNIITGVREMDEAQASAAAEPEQKQQAGQPQP